MIVTHALDAGQSMLWNDDGIYGIATWRPGCCGSGYLLLGCKSNPEIELIKKYNQANLLFLMAFS